MNREQHPSNNAVLGAPPGVPHEQVHALPVTRVQHADGTMAIVSYWRPSAEEYKLIAEGSAIRLMVLGVNHPPVALGVDGDGIL
jgi:hypothetical protein